jgi:hypothetical protein
MSTVIAKNIQVGTSGTATNNFTLYQPASPDGTVRLGVGNTGATTADVITANSSGNVGFGVAPSAWGSNFKALQLGLAGNLGAQTGARTLELACNAYNNSGWKYQATDKATLYYQYDGGHYWSRAASGTAGNAITFTDVMALDASGNLLLNTTGTTAVQSNTAGALTYRPSGQLEVNGSGTQAAFFGRTSDGMILGFYESGTREGSIDVSGTTVSYNGGHLARWAQTTGPKDESLVKGTVLSNLDAMNQYTDAEGNPIPNEQLNKVKVSDVEGDSNVAGVFVNWTHDEQHNVDEINMAMTGDMIIRIAQGVTVQRGDLLMSAGDGTAKPQGDDIVRSKTVAKVTSNHVTCTYADGSYCVPCVLMAC